MPARSAPGEVDFTFPTHDAASDVSKALKPKGFVFMEMAFLSCPKSVLYPCMFVAAEYIYKAHSLVFFYEPPERGRRGRKVARLFLPLALRSTGNASGLGVPVERRGIFTTENCIFFVTKSLSSIR